MLSITRYDLTRGHFAMIDSTAACPLLLYAAMSSRSWLRVFTYAIRGWMIGVRQERNITVHLLAVGVVIAAGIACRISRVEWSMLTLCIAMVIGLELMNSGLERLAKAITLEQNDLIRDALDLAAGAVFFAACGAMVVGCFIFLPRLWLLFAQS